MYTNHFSPSRTAVTMAVARAIHQLLDEPIVLNDDNAQLFLDQDTKHKIANNPYAFNDPMARTMRAAVVARNCMVLDALKAAKKSKPDIVVLCASDEDYETMASEAFKALNNDFIVVLAGYPANVVEQLKQEGMKNFIHVKSNILEELKRYQQMLGIV